MCEKRIREKRALGQEEPSGMGICCACVRSADAAGDRAFRVCGGQGCSGAGTAETGLSVSAAGKAAVVQGQQKEVVPVTLAAAVLQESIVYELPEENSAVIGTALSGQALNICGQTADGWYETCNAGGGSLTGEYCV